MPPTITTVVSCILAQFGAYTMAKSRGNAWMSSTSPDASATFGDAIGELFHSFYTTWTSASNYYDANQWCMMWILRGSMTLYLVLLGLARAKPSMRRLVLLGLFAWSWKSYEGETIQWRYIGFHADTTRIRRHSYIQWHSLCRDVILFKHTRFCCFSKPHQTHSCGSAIPHWLLLDVNAKHELGVGALVHFHLGGLQIPLSGGIQSLPSYILHWSVSHTSVNFDLNRSSGRSHSPHLFMAWPAELANLPHSRSRRTNNFLLAPLRLHSTRAQRSAK